MLLLLEYTLDGNKSGGASFDAPIKSGMNREGTYWLSLTLPSDADADAVNDADAIDDADADADADDNDNDNADTDDDVNDCDTIVDDNDENDGNVDDTITVVFGSENPRPKSTEIGDSDDGTITLTSNKLPSEENTSLPIC